jgi:uncharacterized protein YkwD
MRVLGWLGGILVMVAITTGAVAASGRQPEGARPVAASRTIATAGVGTDSSDLVPGHMRSRPTPAPSPAPSAAPAPAPAAAPAPAPPPAGPSVVIGSTQQVLINGDRAAAGLRLLSWNSCLYSVAVSNATRMAAQGFISHTNGPNVDLGCHLGSYAGENVGYWTGGVNDSQINTMFMNSPDHRANIMGSYHYVATAWVTASNGVAYIAVEFG